MKKILMRYISVIVVLIISTYTSSANLPPLLPQSPFIGSDTYSPSGLYLDGYIAGRFRYQTGIKFDEQNVPLIKYQSGFEANPTSVAQSGLQEFNYAINSSNPYPDALQNSIDAANWLIRNQKRDGTFRYNFDFSVGGMSETLKSGWISSMAQGQAISLLVRIYFKTEDVKYLRAANKAILPLLRRVKSGGAMNTIFGYRILEEYPTLTAPSGALNGWLFSLLGVYDLASTGSIYARDLWNDQMLSLEHLLPKYYLGKNSPSAYHLGFLTKPKRKPHVSSYYHKVHIIQLTEIVNLHESAILRKWLQLFVSAKVS